MHAVIAERIRRVVEASRQFAMELAAELDALDDEDFAYFIALDSQSMMDFPSASRASNGIAAALEREDLARRKYEESVQGEIHV